MFATLRRLQASAAYTQAMQNIKVDLKQAMIGKKNVEKNTIRSILSTIKNNEIDGGKQDEFELYKVFTRMLKQRAESEALYKSQNRADLAQVEAQESVILKKYLDGLPLSSDEEVLEKVQRWLSDVHELAKDTKMGDLLKGVTDEFALKWNTTPSSIRSKVPAIYKKLWAGK